MAPEIEQRLLQAALSALDKAYTPYSHFHVGAAVLDERGQIHSGCNVENAAYPEGLCAEAGAISAMVLGGGRKIVAAMVAGESVQPVTPCGGCRQKLREFAALDTPVYTANAHGINGRFTLGQLLPDSFGPEHLYLP
jgi:cytidine deaminase